MKKVLLAIPVSFALSNLAPAQTQFSEIDADGDGYVTAEESVAIPGLAEVIAEFDGDGDGKLDEGEFTQYLEMADPPDSGG